MKVTDNVRQFIEQALVRAKRVADDPAAGDDAAILATALLALENDYRERHLELIGALEANKELTKALQRPV